MKIIHAADIHLGSKMDSRFPKEIAEKRKTEVRNTFRRLAHQIVESEGGAENLVIIGIRTRGVTVAERIKACLDSIEGTDVPMGV